MNNRKKMVAAVICVLVVLAAVVVVIYGGRDSGKGSETESAGILSAAENTVENTADGDGQEKGFSTEKASEDAAETEKASGEMSEEESEKKNEEESEKKESKGNVASDQDAENQQSSQIETKKASAETSKSSSDKISSVRGDSENASVSLPYSIPDSGLVIEKFAGYDGIFIEDGSDSDISGVTVMVLTNKGKTNVEYVNISVKRDGKELKFEASAIPAGASVVVQEAGKTAYKKGTYTDCSADVASADTFEMSKNLVKVEDNGDNSLTITNLTDRAIPCVRVFYKFYMEDEDTYVGGITYTAKITGLEAGKSQKVTPSHFVSGSSRIMMVRTYDTEE